MIRLFFSRLLQEIQIWRFNRALDRYDRSEAYLLRKAAQQEETRQKARGVL